MACLSVMWSYQEGLGFLGGRFINISQRMRGCAVECVAMADVRKRHWDSTAALRSPGSRIFVLDMNLA